MNLDATPATTDAASGGKLLRAPDLSGMSLEVARLMLANLGFEPPEVLFRESYETRDTVLAQQPARGMLLPRNARITLWVARRGYLQHLPAIYRRSDAVGKNLTRDLCFLLEHIWGSIEDVVEHESTYFDPATCPPDFLPFLGSWLAFAVEFDWPLERKRLLVKHAMTLFRKRGTAAGIRLFIRLSCGLEADIRENEWPFVGFRVDSEARIGVDSIILPVIEKSRCFVVRMRVPYSEVTPETVVRLHQVIAREKPANTVYCLRFSDDDGRADVREFMPIGMGTGIGVYTGQEP